MNRVSLSCVCMHSGIQTWPTFYIRTFIQSAPALRKALKTHLLLQVATIDIVMHCRRVGLHRCRQGTITFMIMIMLCISIKTVKNFIDKISFFPRNTHHVQNGPLCSFQSIRSVRDSKSYYIIVLLTPDQLRASEHGSIAIRLRDQMTTAAESHRAQSLSWERCGRDDVRDVRHLQR